jgi:hypothetical protein
MKNKITILLCAGVILLGGCAKEEQNQSQAESSVQVETEQATEAPNEIIEPTEISIEPTVEIAEPTEVVIESTEEIAEPTEIASEATTENSEAQTTAESALDDTIYIGEYLDYDNNEPNLEIAKGDDGKYIVQIGIFRLTSLEDGVGELTEEGMKFTATDAAGNPISGVITVENQIATVTFTDSTWDYLENGSTFQYTKSSDTPNVWSEY